MIFVNDKRPRATSPDGRLQTSEDWELLTTIVEDRASLGSGAVILGGVSMEKKPLSAVARWLHKTFLLGLLSPATPRAGSPRRHPASCVGG